MNTSQKVALIRSISGDYSLSAALGVLGLPKSTWYYRRHHDVDYQEKYAHLQPLLERVAREHPAYGYRRTTAELHETYQEQVNHKVVQRLHQLWGLALLRTTRAPKPSGIRKIRGIGSMWTKTYAKSDILGQKSLISSICFRKMKPRVCRKAHFLLSEADLACS